MSARDELAQLLAIKERASMLELVPSQDVEFLLSELAKYKRGARTLGEIIEKQCRDVLDVTGLHHLINEDGDGAWDVVWMRLHEMRDELAALKAPTIGAQQMSEALEAELLKVASLHHINGIHCWCGFKSLVIRDRTKHIMDAALEAAGYRKAQ